MNINYNLYLQEGPKLIGNILDFQVYTVDFIQYLIYFIYKCSTSNFLCNWYDQVLLKDNKL